MIILFIINDPPYGTEKLYNALRLVMSMQKESPEIDIRIFLMADSVTASLPNQSTPDGYYNIEKMLGSIISKGGNVKLCGTCVKARGLKELSLIDGVEISTMKKLTEWVVEADKILTF